TRAATKLDCRSATIDGEVIVQNECGASDFEALKSAIRWRPQSLIFCAFDVLHLNRKDLRDRPLLERRAKVKKLLLSEHLDRLHQLYLEVRQDPLDPVVREDRPVRPRQAPC